MFVRPPSYTSVAGVVGSEGMPYVIMALECCSKVASTQFHVDLGDVKQLYAPRAYARGACQNTRDRRKELHEAVRVRPRTRAGIERGLLTNQCGNERRVDSFPNTCLLYQLSYVQWKRIEDTIEVHARHNPTSDRSPGHLNTHTIPAPLLECLGQQEQLERTRVGLLAESVQLGLGFGGQAYAIEHIQPLKASRKPHRDGVVWNRGKERS